ncbi:hypothetical protein ID866_5703 [Astraeus odoratus]|nr:hypothetical protein ID866_5703 [Astraeus odoratus]
MNVDFSRSHDSFFGPPSEPINVRKFIEEATAVADTTNGDVLGHLDWQQLSDGERDAIEAECSQWYVWLLRSFLACLTFYGMLANPASPS